MLTMADVRGATPTDKDRVVWDKPGFGVRIRPSGAKSWLVQYRNQQGQNRRMTLGRIDQLPLAQARREADRIIAAARLGQDPAIKRTEGRRSPTVREVAKDWIERAQDREGRPLRPKTKEEYQRQLNAEILPVIGSLKVRSLTHQQVRALFNRIGDSGRPVLANRVLATISSLLSWAVERDLLDANANPAHGINRKSERADKRALSEEETHRFLAACEHLRAEGGYPGRMAVCFELMLLCGLRPSDAYKLKWSEINYEAGLIQFESQKTPEAEDEAKPAYLRGPAAALLKSLDKSDDTYVFPSRRLKGQPVSDARKVWAKVEELAEFDREANPKHLRKTHGSLARNWRHDLGAISKSLRHASQRTTEKHYAFLGDPLVAAEEDVIQARIASLANPKADVKRLPDRTSAS